MINKENFPIVKDVNLINESLYELLLSQGSISHEPNLKNYPYYYNKEKTYR